MDFFKFLRKQLKEHRNHKSSRLESSLAKHEKINGILDDVRHDLDADRVYLSQIHNGTVTTASMHMFKFTMTHERTAISVSKEKNQVIGVPIEDHLKAVRALVDQSIVCINDLDKVNPTLTVALLQSMGVQSGVYGAVRDKTGTVVAFLGVEYTDKKGGLDNETIKSQIQRFLGLLQIALIDYPET